MKADDRFMKRFGANVKAAAKTAVLKAAQTLELEIDPVFEALDRKLAICVAFFDPHIVNDIETMLAVVPKFGGRHQTAIGVDVAL